MKSRTFDLNVPVGYDEEMLRTLVRKKTRHDGPFIMLNKSLDARNRRNIHWKIRVEVLPKKLSSLQSVSESGKLKQFQIPYRKRTERIVVVGSGPAGFFTAYALQKGGYRVEIIEQGSDVDNREQAISHFETGGPLNERNNYAYGEGGAGTFSDGKLTARSKKNRIEKEFVFDSFVEAGAPEEIKFLSSPHLGSDNLKQIVRNLRTRFQDIGGKIHFDTRFDTFQTNSKQRKLLIKTDRFEMSCDYLILAIGHSSLQTYRTLLKQGIPFRSKPFAIGSRVEHLQTLINRSQWGLPNLSGVKAAEYKLTFKSDQSDILPVYSFCMCPGGRIVPASTSRNTSIVNGMSNYQRDLPFANAAIVAAVDLNKRLNREVSPGEALDWLFQIENRFFELKQDFRIPARKISDFIRGKSTAHLPDSTYPFPRFDHDFETLFPADIHRSLIEGLKSFSKKISGFEEGTIMGLESKTSAPIQVIRERDGRVVGFDRVYMVGEGSGFAGGIVSSAIDGMKTAIPLLES